MQANDLTDPAPATSALDATTVLSRQIAEVHPAVDPLDSTSRS